MYIVRWLMGHPIIATWVLGAIAILLTTGSGKKDNVAELAESGDKHPAVTVKTKDSAEVADSTVIDGSKGIESKAQQGASRSVASVASNQAKTATAEAKSVAATLSTSLREKTEEAGSLKDAGKVDSVAVEVQSNDEKLVAKKDVVSAPNVAPADAVNHKKAAFDTPKNTVTETKSAAVADLGEASTEEMLLMAREAYWNNGLDEAAQIYSKLIEKEPKVLEHKGELGNVYWRQGYPKKAAEIYSEIAIPMIDLGGTERVANMVGFIGLFYPDRAAEIQKRIQLKQTKSQ